MALSITNRGTGTHNTGATSFTLSPGSNFTAGATAVLCVAADNSSSGGTTNDFTTVTDGIGNTWTKRQSPVFDNGAASAGVQGAIYDCEQNVGTLQTSTVITVSFGSSPVAKTWTLTEINHGASKIARFQTGGNKAAGATATAATSGASGTINIAQAAVFAIFIEAGTTQTCTGDSDTTNGSWSTLQYAEIGSTTSGSCIASQAKVQTTANSTQTYDVTLGISSDYHSSWAIYSEVDAAINVTPTQAVAAAGAASPTVTFGALSVTPTQAVSASAAAAPAVTFGALNVTPTAAISTATAAAPTVTFGALGVTPTPAIAAATAAAPDVQLPIGVTPIPAIASASGATPVVTFGALSVTPGTAVAGGVGASPAVTFGALSIAPTFAAGNAMAASPVVSFGTLTVTPTCAIAVATAASPTVQVGGGAIDVTPGTAGAAGTAASPTVLFGALAVSFEPAVAAATARNANVYIVPRTGPNKRHQPDNAHGFGAGMQRGGSGMGSRVRKR